MRDAPQPRRRTTVGWSVLATAATVVAVALGASLLPRSGDSAPIRGTGKPPATSAPAPPTGTPMSTSDLLALTRPVKCRAPVPGAVSREDLMAFRAVTAVSCTTDVRELPGQGQWTVDVRRVATAGVADLQAALERPDEPVTDGACPAIGVVPLPLVLVDASGHTLVPDPPVDGCRLPQQAFTDALGQVAWREVWAHPVRQILTPEAEKAHCAQEFKNMTYIEGRAGQPPGPGGPVVASPPSTVQVCIYRVTGADLAVGTFQRGLTLSAADTRSLLAALTGPGPTGDCPAERVFAVINGAGGDWATVELGGCWRVASSESGLGTADPTVVGEVLGNG